MALALLSAFAGFASAVAQPPAPPAARPAGPRSDLAGSEPLVLLSDATPAIVIELRYASEDNFTGRALYPPDFPCLVRQSVAERLRYASATLAQSGRRLKIWDGYRPMSAQAALWSASGNKRYVGNPEHPAQCLHNWGVAVDATLVDLHGRPVPMPSSHDEFSETGSFYYSGSDPSVAANLRLLKRAMGQAGFLGVGSEWWHFVAKDWARFGPVSDAKAMATSPPAPQTP